MQGNKFAILKDGQLEFVDMVTWGIWFENIANRQVAQDQINTVRISTVFLGLNHGFSERPLWFETMVFGGVHDQYQRRYETLEEAKQGHQETVQMVQGTF